MLSFLTDHIRIGCLICTTACFSILQVMAITVDLRNPTFSEGILETHEGGVVTAPNVRIQAQKIRYIRNEVDGKAQLEAEEDLIIEFGEYIFVGKRLEYNFEEHKGILYQGRTGIEPWFIGEKKFILIRTVVILFTMDLPPLPKT